MFTRHTRSMVFAAVAFGVAGTLCAASAAVSTASLRALPERAAARIAVDRVAAPTIMARVRGASAHYMPMRGSTVPRIETGARLHEHLCRLNLLRRTDRTQRVCLRPVRQLQFVQRLLGRAGHIFRKSQFHEFHPSARPVHRQHGE